MQGRHFATLTDVSQLSIRHFYKTDTYIRRKPGAGPGLFLVILL